MLEASIKLRETSNLLKWELFLLSCPANPSPHDKELETDATKEQFNRFLMDHKLLI